MGATVYVCRKCKRHARVAKRLRARGGADVRMVACQKICKAPVVGVEMDGRTEWFARVGGSERLRALVRVVRSGRWADLPDVLERRRVARRSGRPPR